MDNLSIRQLQNDIYNKEPVYYCKSCLSLKIRNIVSMEDSDYCDECGSTNIETCSIEEWEDKYKEKTGHRFLDKY